MHKCCPECGIEIHKNTICCSRNCSNKHQAKIRKSKIDSETGLTLAQLYAAKTAKIRHENGSYKSESFIEACRKTALITFFSDETKKKRKEYIELASIVGPDGKNKFQKSAEKTVQTKIERGQYTPFEQKNEFAQYTLLARYFSERNDLSQLKNFDKRGRAGTAGAYHLDHIYSIFDGFNNNVSPEIIGHINNLRFIPWKENVSKHQSSDCTLKELFENTNMEYVKYYAENYTEILKPRKSAEIMNSKKKFCEHCQRTINLGNYSRWHGDKCKQK